MPSCTQCVYDLSHELSVLLSGPCVQTIMEHWCETNHGLYLNRGHNFSNNKVWKAMRYIVDTSVDEIVDTSVAWEHLTRLHFLFQVYFWLIPEEPFLMYLHVEHMLCCGLGWHTSWPEWLTLQCVTVLIHCTGSVFKKRKMQCSRVQSWPLLQHRHCLC